jgi:hypothetical protein
LSNGETLDALAREARQLGQDGRRMAEAVEVNTRILELGPGNLPAFTRRGLSYLKLDDCPAARKALTCALRLNSKSSLVAEALKKIDRGWDAALERARGGPDKNLLTASQRKCLQTKSRRQRAGAQRRSSEGPMVVSGQERGSS